ncbi:MAG TPA: hypothetical protein VGD45_26505 [Steroidobacter sp.]|uniref:hypothetical protein n=1 Tax=Steroidobacter sp. TaxID=1978227 RepID=UPI002ED84D5F
MQSLPLGEIGATPWSLNPSWFIALAFLVPALLWFGLAWRRALLECPNRIRRAGIKEMRRLLDALQRSSTPPRPGHLQAWLRVTARSWDIRTSAPCVGEVSRAAHTLSGGDPIVSDRWRELWQATEHGLYAPDAQPTRDWVQRARSLAASLEMPKRERLFPNRLAHWLPSVAGALLVIVMSGSQSLADVPWSSPPAAEAAPDAPPPDELSPQAADDARAALASNWNDWAAHRNLAAFQTQQGELSSAIAHAAAAFIQHPIGSDTRETLLAALGETETVDRNLRQLLSGAWYERTPTLLSPAGWQRLALIAAIVTVAAACALIFVWYSPAKQPARSRLPVLWIGRSVAALGAIVLLTSVASWHAYGAFGHARAAILVENANVSPVPTDLVPTEETSPLSAGAVVVAGHDFLGWRKIDADREISGWVRGHALMPLYADR